MQIEFFGLCTQYCDKNITIQITPGSLEPETCIMESGLSPLGSADGFI
jgi:hypothetical protein